MEVKYCVLFPPRKSQGSTWPYTHASGQHWELSDVTRLHGTVMSQFIQAKVNRLSYKSQKNGSGNALNSYLAMTWGHRYPSHAHVGVQLELGVDYLNPLKFKCKSKKFWCRSVSCFLNEQLSDATPLLLFFLATKLLGKGQSRGNGSNMTWLKVQCVRFRGMFCQKWNTISLIKFLLVYNHLKKRSYIFITFTTIIPLLAVQ